jgi:hypothetical protein
MDRSNHTLHQMTMNDPGVADENTDEDADIAAHTGEGVANSDPDNAAMPQSGDRSGITTPTFFSPEIPESDGGATLEGERQLHPVCVRRFHCQPPWQTKSQPERIRSGRRPWQRLGL